MAEGMRFSFPSLLFYEGRTYGQPLFFRQYSQMCSFPIVNHSSMMQRHSYKLLSDGRLLPDILRHRLVPKFQMRL